MEVLILGAGFGGLELSTRLSQVSGVRTTLIDKNDSFLFGFSKLDVMVGRESVDAVRMYYRDVNKPGVEFRQETVTSIDPATRKVTTDRATYEPDILVVALGADYEPEATPGFVEDGFDFYTLEGAQRLRDTLPTVTSGTVVVSILQPPFKCPPAPYEGAFLIHDLFTKTGVRDRVDLQLFSPMDSPIPVSRETSEAIVKGFEERSIKYAFGRRVTSLDPQTKTASFADGGSMTYDMFIGIPKHRVPRVVEESGLTKDGIDGWIHVDPRNLRTPYDGIYAIGDCADAPIPRAGVFAEAEAVTVAEDIAARLRGGDEPDKFPGRGICYIEFGGGQVAKVDVDFLSGPSPVAPFTPPSADILRDKYELFAARRKRWFS